MKTKQAQLPIEKETGSEVISFRDVCMQYGPDGQALCGINVSIHAGEFVFLCGPSGAGKSTMIKLMTCETRPTSGEVVVNGYRIVNIRQHEIPFLRRTLGVVFQDFRLIQKKTVYDNVAFAMKVIGVPNHSIRRRVRYALELVGLSSKAKNKPNQLSGGEQQRVAIARALVNNPSIIIADEPTGNLDPERSLETMELLQRINELGTTVVVITHEKELVNRFAKRVVFLDKGNVVSDKTGGYYHE